MCAAGQQRVGSGGVPNLGALFGKKLQNALIQDAIHQRLVAAFAKEDRDGDAPNALARDAPVRPRGDHVGDALLAPCRVPFHAVFDFVERALPERQRRAIGTRAQFLHRVIDVDEPLLGRAKDDRVVAAPAMRVAMEDVRPAEESAAAGHQINDGLVRLEDGLAVVLGQTVVDPTRIVDVAGLIQAVTRAGVEVVCTMGRRSVDGAGSLIGCDVIGEDAKDFAVEEWVAEGHALHP